MYDLDQSCQVTTLNKCRLRERWEYLVKPTLKKRRFLTLRKIDILEVDMTLFSSWSTSWPDINGI